MVVLKFLAGKTMGFGVRKHFEEKSKKIRKAPSFIQFDIYFVLPHLVES
jgi:hypothetical protein